MSTLLVAADVIGTDALKFEPSTVGIQQVAPEQGSTVTAPAAIKPAELEVTEARTVAGRKPSLPLQTLRSVGSSSPNRIAAPGANSPRPERARPEPVPVSAAMATRAATADLSSPELETLRSGSLSVVGAGDGPSAADSAAVEVSLAPPDRMGPPSAGLTADNPLTGVASVARAAVAHLDPSSPPVSDSVPEPASRLADHQSAAPAAESLTHAVLSERADRRARPAVAHQPAAVSAVEPQLVGDATGNVQPARSIGLAKPEATGGKPDASREAVTGKEAILAAAGTAPEPNRGERLLPGEATPLREPIAPAPQLSQPTPTPLAQAAEPQTRSPATLPLAAASQLTAGFVSAEPLGTTVRSDLRVTAGQLGPVSIRIERSGPALNVTLGATRADAESVLRDGLDTLERSLAASNAGPLALSVSIQPGRDERAAARHERTLLVAATPSLGDLTAPPLGPLPPPAPSVALADPPQRDQQQGNPASTGPYPPASGSPADQSGTPQRHAFHGHSADTPSSGVQPDGERSRHGGHASTHAAAPSHTGYRRANPSSATRQPARSALKGRVHVLA
jgi:hypothetical protein